VTRSVLRQSVSVNISYHSSKKVRRTSHMNYSGRYRCPTDLNISIDQLDRFHLFPPNGDLRKLMNIIKACHCAAAAAHWPLVDAYVPVVT